MKKLIISAVVAALVAAVPASSVYAQNAGGLTVSSAVSMVMANSEELKKNSESKSLNDLQRDDLIDQLKTAEDESKSLTVTIQLMQNEIQNSAYSDTAAVFKDKATYSVEQIFASIMAAENDLALTNQNLKISQKEYAIAKVKRQVGKISELELKNVKLAYEKLEKSITVKENTISKAYTSLNELMGSSLSNRYNLQFNVSYAPIENVNINSTIGIALSDNGTIQNLSKSMDLAEYKYNAYRNDPDTSYADQESLKNAANQAQRNYSSGITDLESNVISAYRSVVDLESDMASAQLALEGLKQQLDVKKKEYEVGKITELELDKLNLQVAQQQESIRKITYDHYLKVKQYRNANLL